MTKRLLCAIMALMFIALTGMPALASVVKPGKDFYYLDQAGVLSEALEGEIYFSNKRLYEACGSQMVVVTIDSTGGRRISDYAVDLFNQWGIGDKKANNGFLLLLAIKDDNYYALCGDNLQPRLTSGQLKTYMNDYLEADFAAKRYEDGVKKLYEAVFKRIADTYNADVTVEQGIADYRAWKGLPRRDDYFGGTPSPSPTPTPTPTPTPLPFHVPAQTAMFYCADEADILSEDTEGKIFFVAENVLRKQKTANLSGSSKFQRCIFVATVKSTEGVPIHDYACAVFKEWGLKKFAANAMLLVISADDGAMELVWGPKPDEYYWVVKEYIPFYSQMNKVDPADIPALDDYEAVTLFMLKNMARSCNLTGEAYDAAIAEYEAWKLDPKDEPELLPLFGEKVRPTPTPSLPPEVQPDEWFYVLDRAELLPEKTERRMAFTSKLLDDATGAQLVVVTVEDTCGIPTTSYARILYDQWGIGSADGEGGLLLLIDQGNKNYCVVRGADCCVAYSDLTNVSELKDLEEKYAKGDFHGAILGGYKGLLSRYCRSLYFRDYFEDRQYLTYEDGMRAYDEWVKAGSDSSLLNAQGRGGYAGAKALTRGNIQKKIEDDRKKDEEYARKRKERERREKVETTLAFIGAIALVILGVWAISHPGSGSGGSDFDSWGGGSSGGGHSSGGGGFGGGGGGGGHSSGGGAGR